MTTLLGDARIRIRPDTSNFQREASTGVSRAMAGIGAVIKKSLVATGAVTAIAGGIGLKTAAQLEQAQIGFTTMLGSAQKADAFLKQLSAFAAKTPFEFPELQTAASSLISVGISADKVIPIMTSLGNATSGMGTGAEGVQRATVALQQMTAAGRITAEDLNQLRDAGIPVYDLLAKATGKSTAAVVELASKGKLGKKELDQLMGALASGKGLERFDGLMQKQSQSLTGLFSTLKDTVQLRLAEAITPAIPYVKKGMEALAPILDKALGGIGRGIGRGVAAVKQFADSPAWATIQETLSDTATRLRAFSGSETWAAMQEALNGVKAGFVALRPAAGALFDYLANTAAPAVASVVEWMARNRDILIPLTAGILTAVGAYKAYLILSKTVAVATKLWAAAQVALNVVLTLNPIGLVVAAIAGLVVGLVIAYKKSETFRRIVQTAMAGVATAFTTMWTAAKAVVGWISRVPANISGAFSSLGSLLRSKATSAWESFASSTRSKLNGIVSWVSKVPGRMGSALKNLGSAMGAKALEGARRVAGDINKYLVGNLNKVTTKFNVTIPSIPKFAAGGEVPGSWGKRGRDSVPALLMPDEHVWTTREVSGAGGHAQVARLRALAAAGKLQGYKDGGPIGKVKDFFGDAAGLGRKVTGSVGDWVLRGAGFATDAALKPIMGTLRKVIGTQPAIPNGFVMGTLDKFAESARSWGRKQDTAGGALGAGSIGGMGFQRQMAALRTRFPGLALTSGFRPGAITATGNASYHGKGRAVDVPPRMDVFNWIRQNYGAKTKELIYSPANGRQIHNGKPHMYSGITRSMHFDHVHWAYDRGGLAKGKGLLRKDTVRPERVLSPRQTQAFEGAMDRGAFDGGNGGGTVLVEVSFNDDRLAGLIDVRATKVTDRALGDAGRKIQHGRR